MLEPLERAARRRACARPPPTSASGRGWSTPRHRGLDRRRALAATDIVPLRRHRSDGAVVGSTSYLNVVPEHRRLEIGNTWNNPSAWGTGANTEAKYLLLRHAFETLGCTRVEFKTDAQNDRARAALAALPAEFEGIHRKHMVVRGGERRDSAWYAVIDDDWPEVKARARAAAIAAARSRLLASPVSPAGLERDDDRAAST